MLHYEEIAPPPALAGNVACFWTIRGTVDPGCTAANRVLPDGCMDVIFDFGDPMRGDAAGNGHAMVVGTMRRALVVEHEGRVDVMGVRFRPGGAVPLLGIPAADVTDRTAGLDLFWRDARGIADFLNAADPGHRVARFESVLLDRVRAARPADALVRAASRMIRQARGNIAVRTLEQSLRTPSRTLERRFLAAVGISPKAVCRVARMQHAAAMLRSTASTSIAAIAVIAGFHDQAHLTRDFSSLAGITPGAFLNEGSVGFLQDEDVPAA
jgi:AraC-like DNA-binding protein